MTDRGSGFEDVVLGAIREGVKMQWRDLVNRVASRCADENVAIPRGGFERVLNITVMNLEDRRLAQRSLAGVTVVGGAGQ
ncbi:Uncharacterised protein [Mycobacteroides abscessus subsp. abscessus]|uniref:hypothetical protein n=1 Tax=Mycobacteroides abscessus TaxID=36809 RepID=UPI000929B28D|nr:hypothetical protein [Mycobacteroides abscessus]SIM25921.1 Uncharacterised protein [Mycobacteroides abscessus subsp. abscessus]SLC78740.1 Uncharacterised protein [Mycobacteroides abscessus subsp. abscessus]